MAAAAKQGDNKAMAFLRKKGKVGGTADFSTNSMGVDEGPAGKTTSGASKVRKNKSASEVFDFRYTFAFILTSLSP